MKANLFVEHVILSENTNGKTKQLVLYLNANTPYEYEYYVNTTNRKGSGGGIGYDNFDYALQGYNKIDLTNTLNKGET